MIIAKYVKSCIFCISLICNNIWSVCPTYHLCPKLTLTSMGLLSKNKKSFYFLTKVLCSCHLYVLVVWRVFVFFPFQKILPFDMTLSLPLNNNMSHTEGILFFCGHHVKERISSNNKYIHFYDMEKHLTYNYMLSSSINRVHLLYFDKKWNLLIL